MAHVCLIALLGACSGRGNVDLSKATPLTAEPVASGPAAGQDLNPGTPHHLFNLPPGQWTSFRALGGVIDSVGTTLEQDFDGDGINNDRETTGNIWIADYPVIESQIAPPVTLKVQILKNKDGVADESSTDITSDDIESRKNQGSEKFHQNELAERTVQYEREVAKSSSSASSASSTTSSASASASASASGGGFLGAGGSANVEININATHNSTRNNSYNFNSSSSERTQAFEDRPFKNNLDRGAVSVKAENAAKNARNFRRDKRERTGTSYVIQPNAGVVRAALYIKNQSVNMPVRLTNILVSLVFESGTGELIPIESFRLRNDDYSLFTIDVYGNSEVGPYVIELKNLNTAEVENAINAGYTPKIHVIDYMMRHVENSNYREALSSNFTGDNLKIIEENAKGRTALIKLIGPNFREAYRIAAFETTLVSGQTNFCDPANIITAPDGAIKPGASLRAVLEKLKCSGINIEFGHFVYDFSGTSLAPLMPRVYMYGIKSVNGRSFSAPCETPRLSGVGFGSLTPLDPQDPLKMGPVSDVCWIKLNNLTEEQIFNLSLWSVFDNGKYYNQAEIMRSNTNDIITFDGLPVTACGTAGGTCGIPIIKGIESTVWAGDNYDVTYVKLADLLNRVRSHGTNPLETHSNVLFNTSWSEKEIGQYPYYPNVKSIYLGQAAVGDKIEVKIKLDDTLFLNPDFGTPEILPARKSYSDFTYNPRKELTKLFNISEAIDFEMSMGLGGNRSDWTNLLRGTFVETNKTLPHAKKIKSCGENWNFLAQEYTFCLILPSAPDGVGNDGVLNVYLRTGINNTYRKSIWPQEWRKIKKFEARVKQSVSATSLKVGDIIGNPSDVLPGNTVTLQYTAYAAGSGSSSSSSSSTSSSSGGQAGSGAVFETNNTIVSVTEDAPVGSGIYTVVFLSDLNLPGLIKLGGRLTVDPPSGAITGPTMRLDVDSGFENYWNASLPIPGGSSTPDVNPLIGSGSLLSGDYSTTDCVILGGFRSNHCLGYNMNYQLSNWLGYEAYNNSMGDLKNFTKSDIQKLVSASTWSGTFLFARELKPTANPLGFVQVPAGADYSVSSQTGSNQSGLKVANAGKYILSVWESDANGANAREIRGRIVDIETGLLVGSGDFLISPVGVGDNQRPEVVAVGTKALVIWQNAADFTGSVRGRIVDLVGAKVLGFADFAISMQHNNVAQLSIAVETNRALVAWVSAQDAVPRIYGRVVDMTTGDASGSVDFQISMNSDGQVRFPAVSVKGNRAVVVFQQENASQVGPDIRGRLVDISALTALAQDFAVSFSNDFSQSMPQVKISGNRALVVWQSNDTDFDGSKFKIKGRVLNMDVSDATATMAPMGVVDFTITAWGNLSAPFYNYSPKLEVYGYKAFIVWQSITNTGIYEIRGRIIDFQNAYHINSEIGPNIGKPEFILSASDTSEKFSPTVGISGTRALITWNAGSTSTIYPDIKARLFDLAAEVMGGNSELTINQTTNQSQMSASSVIFGNRSAIFWQSNHDGANTHIYGRLQNGDIINMLPYGLNNFFVAPLIERNFTANARILR